MWRFYIFALFAYSVNCAPQFVGVKDGKIGVSFGGYHAAAGLGGLLTGDAAHGGLSASAGTPFGQEAAAGLGGAVNGRAAGGGYATASAGGNIGASAGLGGDVGGEIPSSGGLEAEAHIGGYKPGVVAAGNVEFTKQIPVAVEVEGGNDFQVSGAATQAAAAPVVVQKIKPHKKHYIEVVPTNTVVVEKRIEIPTVQQEVETVHEVVPVKQKHVKTQVETVVPQPAFNFQKSFGFQLGGGFAPQAVPAAPAVSTASASAAALAPALPQYQEYYAPSVVYRKHYRPLHHRAYVQKYYKPYVFQPQPQPQVVPVVQKQKQVYVQSAAPAVPYYGGTAVQGRIDANAGSFFDSIFNIPISTLKAVNGLLNTGVQGSGGFAVEKRGGFALG